MGIVSIFNKYGFELTKERVHSYEFYNKQINEYIYLLPQKSIKIVINPAVSVFYDFSSYISKNYHNNSMIAFPKRDNGHGPINYGVQLQFDTVDELDKFLEYYCSNSDVELDSEPQTFFEGSKSKKELTVYERSRLNRIQAISIHGLKCEVCGFDFGDKYGDWGMDYIEVHHKNPLYTSQVEVAVNPKTDLACLCSNCHRMIHHKKNQMLTVEQLKSIVCSKELKVDRKEE